MKKSGETIYKFNSRLIEVDWGRLSFSVSLGNDSVSINAVESADPFPGIKAWLEAIAVGVEECVYTVDEEPNLKQLSFNRSYGRSSMKIVDADAGKTLLSGQVELRQLVADFYNMIKSIPSSGNYRKFFWERQTLYERLGYLSKYRNIDEYREGTKFSSPGKYDIVFPSKILVACGGIREEYNAVNPVRLHEEVIEKLLKYDSLQLRKTFLIFISPHYEDRILKGTAEELENFLWTARVKDDRFTQSPDFLERLCYYFDLPENYDMLPVEEKRKLIAACLDGQASYTEGMKLSEFRSEVIENYLK